MLLPRLALVSDRSDDLPHIAPGAGSSRSQPSNGSGAPREDQQGNLPINPDRRLPHSLARPLPILTDSPPRVVSRDLPALPPRIAPSESPAVPPHTGERQVIAALSYSGGTTSPPAKTRSQNSGPSPVPSAPPTSFVFQPTRRESAASPHSTTAAAAATAAAVATTALDLGPSTPSPSRVGSRRTAAAGRAAGPRGPSSADRQAFTPPSSAIPLLRNEEWKKHKEVNVRIGPNLSPHVAIIDIFRLLKNYGLMERIELLISRSEGVKTGYAAVRFSECFYPFWESSPIEFFEFGPTRVVYQKPGGNRAFVAGKVDSSRKFPSMLVSLSPCLVCVSILRRWGVLMHSGAVFFFKKKIDFKGQVSGFWLHAAWGGIHGHVFD